MGGTDGIKGQMFIYIGNGFKARLAVPWCQAVTSMPAQAALITFLLLKPSTAQFIREVKCG